LRVGAPLQKTIGEQNCERNQHRGLLETLVLFFDCVDAATRLDSSDQAWPALLTS
jgi:hypothetical protein